jgi:hypothetical protein
VQVLTVRLSVQLLLGTELQVYVVCTPWPPIETDFFNSSDPLFPGSKEY